MISIWEKESLLFYDVIIIGAGITGLSTAASLIEKQPDLSILVIEKGTLPTGASTRNAGFACFGSVSELQDDIKQLGEEGMCQLVEKRWKGLEKTRGRLGDKNIGFEASGGYEIYQGSNQYDPEQISRTNKLLKDVIGKEIFINEDFSINDFGFQQVNHLIYNRYEGMLHTGKLMSSLWNYCQRSGVRIITGTEVRSIEPDQGKAFVQTSTHAFECRAAGICTNAFSKRFISEMDLSPGRGMILLIRPEKTPRFKGAFHYESGYYYFRNFGSHIIFGGGRNLDFDTEATLAFGINPTIREKLIDDLKRMIIPGQSFKVEMEWSGIMAFGKSKTPVIQQVKEHVFAGVRLGGMGVAIGSLVGDDLADLIIESHF